MKNRMLFATVTLVAVAIWGCAKPASTPVASSSGSSNTTQADDHAGHDHDHGDRAGHDQGDAAADTTLVSLKYCGDCGHSFAKGSEHTCDADHAKCEACGLHEGSDLCCKIEGDFAGKALCGSCGQIAGSEACCKEGAEVCEKCSLHKGSPLCCKLGVAAAAPAEEAAAAPAEAAPVAEEKPAEAAPAVEKAAEEAPAEAAPAKEGEG